jgi:hypothetical protein
MVEGDAEVHGTFWASLVFQMSYEKLFFHEKGAHRSVETAALATGERTKAWHCQACAGLFLEQPPWIPGYR